MARTIDVERTEEENQKARRRRPRLRCEGGRGDSVVSGSEKAVLTHVRETVCRSRTRPRETVKKAEN